MLFPACLASEAPPIAPRGLLLLGLLNPNFPVQDAAKVLQASPHPAFAFVYRAFGTNPRNYLRLVHALKPSATRPVTVLIYGDCGPCRSPRRPRGLFPLVCPRDSIGSLNRALERGATDALVDIEREFRRIEGIMSIQPGLSYILVPSLEDNFTDKAYATVIGIAAEVFASRPDVRFARNPLKKGLITDAKEIHTHSIAKLKRLKSGDIVSGDGYTLCFPGEECEGEDLYHMGRFLATASRRSVAAFVWRPETQGLPPFTDGSVAVIKPPSRRTYSIPGIKYLRKLMRGDYERRE